MEKFIHSTADVQTTKIGTGTKIWQHCIILSGAEIGCNCNICAFCYIENDVIIGNNVTIKSHISLWDGVCISDNVHVGPNVVFTNDLRHRSKKEFILKKITIAKGASIGANSTILAGINIGKYAMTGIGSVITRDIPDYALVYGNPARVKGWVDEIGNKLEQVSDEIWKFPDGRKLDIKANKIL
ncbi:MAG TPA: acyltransferase [Ignavibacteriaceae bacterium]|nr:acyltransferase [Ignavibacteriaceae bacterium]